MNMKFDNLILYICKNSQNDSLFGRTKLNKLLYFADFGHYREHGKSISGQEYMAIQNGPVPRAMKPALDRMIHAGDVREEHIDVGARRPRCNIVAQRDPDMSAFSEEEIAYVDEVLSKYARMTGTDLANLSHAEPGYRAAFDAGYGQAIQYGTAYLPPYVMVSQAIVARTKKLGSQHGWNEIASA